jgi:hypothetical protein
MSPPVAAILDAWKEIEARVEAAAAQAGLEHKVQDFATTRQAPGQIATKNNGPSAPRGESRATRKLRPRTDFQRRCPEVVLGEVSCGDLPFQS